MRYIKTLDKVFYKYKSLISVVPKPTNLVKSVKYF